MVRVLGSGIGLGLVGIGLGLGLGLNMFTRTVLTNWPSGIVVKPVCESK